jgi:hypothetical protein
MASDNLAAIMQQVVAAQRNTQANIAAEGAANVVLLQEDLRKARKSVEELQAMCRRTTQLIFPQQDKLPDEVRQEIGKALGVFWLEEIKRLSTGA